MTCTFCFHKLYYVSKEQRKMAKEIIIKKQKIGDGKPLICIPIVEQEQESILKTAKNIVGMGANIIEWRMDWYKNICIWEQTKEILKELADICQDTVLLCTFRSKKQGGEQEIKEEDYTRLLQKVAESGYIDLLDVEVSEISEGKAFIEKLHKASIYIIASQHYFFHTPEIEAMEQELFYMKEIGADIGKLAVMPTKNTDVLRLLEATAHVKEREPEYPIVTIAMGEMGIISRISGQIFGSCFTFATIGKESAPGQLPMKDITGILDKISESMEK